MSDVDRANWKVDAVALARAGRQLFDQRLKVEVRLPTELAESAAAAWRRDDDDDDGGAENPEARRTRHRAGSWALIGLSVQETGREVGAETVFLLDAWHVGTALDAAEEAGLLDLHNEVDG